MNDSLSMIAFVQSLFKEARHNIATLFERTNDDQNYMPDKLSKSEKHMKDTSNNEVLFSVFDIQGPISEPPKSAHQTEKGEEELKEVQLLDIVSEKRLKKE